MPLFYMKLIELVARSPAIISVNKAAFKLDRIEEELLASHQAFNNTPKCSRCCNFHQNINEMKRKRTNSTGALSQPALSHCVLVHTLSFVIA